MHRDDTDTSAQPGGAVTDEPTGQPPPWQIGDACVYPSHGVGKVTGFDLRSKEDGTALQFIKCRMQNGATILAPDLPTSGLRRPMSRGSVIAIFTILRLPVTVIAEPWNRRFRRLGDMARSGDPAELADALRELYTVKVASEDKAAGLSFGEARMYETLMRQLGEEIAVSLDVDIKQAEKMIVMSCQGTEVSL